jgi:alpha-galactosidase
MMGVLGRGPLAVAGPGGVIDVFWRGSADDHLWHGQFTPGSGWDGPQGLGGDLASAPSPAASSPGMMTVFWKGRDGSLWRVTRDLRGRWSPPSSLGMGPLGGAPHATAQPGGGLEVYWSGSGNPHLWEAFYQPRTGWRGPRDLGGDVRSVPWPVTGDGAVRVLWVGSGHRLAVLRHRNGSGWNATGWDRQSALGAERIYSPPFAAVGRQGQVVRVFWRSRDGGLWTAALSARGWSSPIRLGGASRGSRPTAAG